MLYQRKTNADEKEEQKSKQKNNERKILTTTTVEKTITEKKPILTSKPVNISSTVIEKKQFQKNEKITTEVTVTKSEIGASLSTDKKPKFRVYLSSRYRGPKKDDINTNLNNRILSMEEEENNIHTLNARKSPDNVLYKRSYIETENETNMNNINNSQYSIDKKTFIDNENKIINMNENEKMLINNTNPNNKRFRQPMIPQNIMSPIKHYDDGNSLNDNQKYSETNPRLTNNIITNTNTKNENVKYNTTNKKHSSQNTVSYKELKRIVKRFNKVYDPFKNEKGLLIKQSQVTLPGASDEVFNNRYRVLSKMNKLSNILLAKRKKSEEDINNFNNIIIGRTQKNKNDLKSKNLEVKKDKKLLFFSLAMITSKGLKDKEKIILRNMRNEKGGVVDLAPDKTKRNKFKIKKATKVGGGDKKFKRYNQKEKEKAAKTIQSWWKELKDIYNYKLSKIIKIQNMWRGFWVRRNIYDLLYLNYLYLSFCEKIEKVVTRNILRNAFDKLLKTKKTDGDGESPNKNESSEKEIKEEINVNGKKIIKITKITESERIISPIKKDKIIEKDKFKGLLKLIEGVNKYHKKQAFDETKPKIIKYLKYLSKKEILKQIINKKIINNQYVLKKYIYKWLTKATINYNIQNESNESNDKEKLFYSNIKGKLFFRRIENVKNKQKKILLRKYFYRYLKKVLLLGKKEEEQKLINIYKSGGNENYNDNYNDNYNNVKHDEVTIKELKIKRLVKIIKKKEKKVQYNTKKYFYKWINNSFIKKKNDLISKMFIKIIKIIIENRQKKILSKKLNQWRREVNNINGKKDNFNPKSKGTYEFIEHIKKFINKKYSTHFIKQLNNINKKITIDITLKKNIEKRNKKRNYLLVKKAFNKWKNKVADFEIGRLKGKLLLKIYDKYKVIKMKEIIKKKINKWENNTIFMDKIKNKINEESTFLSTKSNININNNNNQITIILKSIIRNNHRKNTDIILRKFFNKWKNNTNDKDLKPLEILNDNKKETALKNILIKYGKLISKDKIKHYYFSKWLFITKSLIQTEFANAIQNFCHTRLQNKLIKNKWIHLYKLLKNRIRKNDIKYIIEVIRKYLSITNIVKILKVTKKLKSIFLDKLNNYKNVTSNQNLKRIIIRQNNKKKHMILKKAINIWRNKVADYEIGILKGKLLVKIYDKYKKNKFKEIIKKKLYKWENNTIFLDKIKNKIHEENESIFTKQNNQSKITIILKSVIRNINRKKNDIILRKFINKWKKVLTNKNKNNNLLTIGNYLLKINNLNNGQYFLDILKDNKKNQVLKNVLIKYGKPKDKILDYYFKKWQYINKRIIQIDNANIIQNFCLTRLKNRVAINKWKKFYNLLKNKNNAKDIKDISKYIKKYVYIKRIIQIIEDNKKSSFKDNIIYFLTRLKLSKKKTYPNLNMKKIIIRKEKLNKDLLLKNSMNIWRNKVADYEIGRLKGKLLLKIYEKYKTNKLKDILNKIIHKWENNTIFIDKIKNKINKDNIDKFTKQYNQDKRIIIFKATVRNINRKNNDILLRKYLNIWKRNVKNKNIILQNGTDKLLKIFKNNLAKYFMNELKDNIKEVKLQNIIMKKDKPKELRLDYYFAKWSYINKKLNQIDNANIIQQFCLMKLKNRKIQNNWEKLYSLLKNKNKKDNINDLLKSLKYYISMTKLTKTLKDINKKNIFDTIKKQKDTKTIITILIEIVDVLEKKKNNNMLKRYLSKWKNATRKKNNKDQALQNMMNILDKKTTKNKVNNISDVFLISKLLKDIPKVRALNFLKHIKKEGTYNKLYKIIAYDLVDTREDLLNVNKKPILHKILKMYVYKILSNLFDKLDKIKKNQNKTLIKEFFRKIYDLNLKNTKFNYNKINKLERQPNIEKGIHFHVKTKPKMGVDDKINKNIIYKQLTPSLVKYLNRRFIYRIEDIFDKIRNNNKGTKFCSLLKQFANKTIIPDKEDLVDSLKYYIYMKIIKENSSNKLYNLVRKAIIRKILNIAKKTGNLTRILEIIKITKTHRRISKDRWLQNIIRRWRFITFVKKMAMKKMELMYKDLHVTYLEMADTVLNEDSPMGPYDRRFIPDMNKDKYLQKFRDPYLVKGAKPYEGIKKQYMFKPIDAEMQKKIKYIREIETKERSKEINNVYYDIDNNNNQYIDGKKIDREFEENKFFKKERNIPNANDQKSSYKVEVVEENNNNKEDNKESYNGDDERYNFNQNRDNFVKNEINNLNKKGKKKFSKMGEKDLDENEYDYGYEYEEKGSGNNEYEGNEGVNINKDKIFRKEKVINDSNKNNNNDNDNNNDNNNKAYYFSSSSYYKGPDFDNLKKED